MALVSRPDDDVRVPAESERKSVNIPESELPFITATRALDAFRAKELSPVELLGAVIGQIERHNDSVGCLTHTYFERAMEQARAAERRYAREPEAARPLEGIPCAIKDWHSVEGEITTYGSIAFKDFRPDQTAPTVERLLDAGAIMHCRTTTPEFAYAPVTRTLLWGTTRNPWNLQYAPGGSSGGAGAAVASGMTTIADGTDGGGSIRIPASACGVFGYKPPWGRNPLDREHPGETVLHYGPITRSVADAALMQNVMSGQHPDDIFSLPDRVELPAAFDDVSGLRVALSPDLDFFEISDVVARNTREVAATYEALGCTVDEVEIGWDGDRIFEQFIVHWESVFWALSKDIFPRWRFSMDPFVQKILEGGSKHAMADFYAMNQTRYDMYAKLGAVLEDHDVLICPTLAVPSVDAEHRCDRPDFEINGRPVYAFTGWVLTYPFNMVSQCPVASAPSGVCPDTGVPTGVQIVGRPFDDLTVFRAAAALERARPWADRRPALAT
jgi:amidase